MRAIATRRDARLIKSASRSRLMAGVFVTLALSILSISSVAVVAQPAPMNPQDITRERMDRAREQVGSYDSESEQQETRLRAELSAAMEQLSQRLQQLQVEIIDLNSRVRALESRPQIAPRAAPKTAKGNRGGKRRDLVAECAAGCTIDNMNDLNRIVRTALPGSVITIANGSYQLKGSIKLEANGSSSGGPIVLRAEELGAVKIAVNSVAGIRIVAPYWQVENLDLQGICLNHSSCEHAFFIIGGASNTVLRNNRMRGFNSAIKGGGKGFEPVVFPDDVVIEGNHIFNGTIRDTANPVTQVDIVGGKRWKIIGNFIADFAKGRGNRISYAGFLKGNSRDGLFERNLVICEWRHTGGVRVGLSYGGGGTKNPRTCEGGDCSIFHTGGIMRNNVILNCPDVGIYLNKSKDTRVFNNTMYGTVGIDGRFPETTADIRNNIVLGRIRERNGGSITERDNIVSQGFGLLEDTVELTDPDNADLSLRRGRAELRAAKTPADAGADFCGNPRTGSSANIGAIAYGSGECNVADRIARALVNLPPS